jgi:cation:H+ antiporter
VSSLAAWEGKPEIGFGNVLGSNVLNISLTLGLVLLFGALSARFADMRRDYLLALAAPVLTLIFALDGTISNVEGLLLLMLFVLWMGLTVRQAMVHRRATVAEEADSGSPLNAMLFMAVGLVCLILAGHLFVTGASGIAKALGVNAFVIGALVVAIGTTLPELVTTLLARWRGHHDVGLGLLIGSNLFNGLAIVGVAASIHPIHAPINEVAIALVFGALSILLILPRAGVIPRWRGMALLATYAGFVTATLII